MDVMHHLNNLLLLKTLLLCSSIKDSPTWKIIITDSNNNRHDAEAMGLTESHKAL